MAVDKMKVRERLTATLDSMYNRVRQNRGLRPTEVISAYVDRVLEDLNDADVHDGLTLEELADRYDELSARERAATGSLRAEQPVLVLAGSGIDRDSGLHSADLAGVVVRHHRRAGVALSEADLNALVADLPALLVELTKRVGIGDEYLTIPSLYSGYRLCDAQNSALRRNLMWLVGETNPSAKVMHELRWRLNRWGTDTYVLSCQDDQDAFDRKRMIARLDRFLAVVYNAIEEGRITESGLVRDLERDRAFLTEYVGSVDPGGQTLSELKDDGDLV